LNGPQRKPIKGIPRQGFNWRSTPWSQLCSLFRADSNAIKVGTTQITSLRLANKPIEWFFHVLCGRKQWFSKHSLLSSTGDSFLLKIEESTNDAEQERIIWT
jgi:hypothetical protein